MSKTQHQKLELPEGMKLLYSPTRNIWAVAIENGCRLSPGMELSMLKGWINCHWTILVNIARNPGSTYSQCQIGELMERL
jgi:hypothetical protein